MTSNPKPIVERLRALLAKAKILNLVGDAHRTQDYAGRSHGFIYNAGELVPLGAIVIGVEGASQDVGRARLDCLVAAVNALPDLLDHIEALEAENARMREALSAICSEFATNHPLIKAGKAALSPRGES